MGEEGLFVFVTVLPQMCGFFRPASCEVWNKGTSKSRKIPLLLLLLLFFSSRPLCVRLSVVQEEAKGQPPFLFLFFVYCPPPPLFLRQGLSLAWDWPSELCVPEPVRACLASAGITRT